jgi:hypothetical protein
MIGGKSRWDLQARNVAKPRSPAGEKFSPIAYVLRAICMGRRGREVTVLALEKIGNLFRRVLPLERVTR